MVKQIKQNENCVATIEGDELVIRVCIDPDEVDARPSKSGKSMVFANVRGPVCDAPDEGEEFGVFLTVYRKPSTPYKPNTPYKS
jgi:hypothetical protein